jgi:hypothetical protein
VAFISGSAAVGYRTFQSLTSDVPSYRGLIADVRARYVLDSTAVDINVSRDLGYSFDPMYPYYNPTDIGVKVDKALGEAWDISGRIGRQILNYRALLGLSGASNVTTLELHQYGAGIGYQVGPHVRIGFEANYFDRLGDLWGRGYNDLRLGSFITYGLARGRNSRGPDR